MKLARTARVAAALATIACTTGTATGSAPSPFTAIPAGFPASCAPDQEGGNYGGPELLARWYERNIVMVHHITRVLKPDTRRVLVLVGSGHGPAMRNILDESPQFCPVSPLPLLQ